MKNVFKLITLITIFVFLQHLTALSAVYLFNSGTETAPSGGGEVVKVNLPSSCTINLAAGTTDTIPLIQLLQQYCGATWTQSNTMKEPEGYYFTRDVKVILEVAGAKGGSFRCSPGKGGYTRIEFLILKNTVWNLNVHYLIGKAGPGYGLGGGGSIIVLGHPNYMESNRQFFPKDKVIAVIAGGGGGCIAGGRGGHGGGGNACGTNGWSPYHKYCTGNGKSYGGCQGNGGAPGGESAPSGMVGLTRGGGPSFFPVFIEKRCSGFFSCETIIGKISYDSLEQKALGGFGKGNSGGGGFGGGGGRYYRCSFWTISYDPGGGAGGGGYCGFFGQPTGCSGITGYNNGDGWGKITLIPQ